MIDTKQAQANGEADQLFIETEEQVLEDMRQAEVERARKIDEAAARGETLDLPHADPAANHAVRITNSNRPGDTRKPS